MCGHSKGSKQGLAGHPETSDSGKSFPPIGPKGQEEEMVLPEFTENWNCKRVVSWWERGIWLLPGTGC